VKGGEHLETLAKLQVLAMDKTGSLTCGQFAVSDFVLIDRGADGGMGGGDGGGGGVIGGQGEEERRKEILRMVLSVEHHSNHPIARAFAKFGEQQGVTGRP
jgi:Cd2+/Zn2+-exporting ATPase